MYAKNNQAQSENPVRNQEKPKSKEQESAQSQNSKNRQETHRKKKQKQRSRSRHRKRSRSRDNHKKNKKKKSKYHRRSQQSSSRSRSRRKRKNDDNRRRSIERGRSRQRKKQKNDYKDNKQHKMPLEVPMPPIPTQVPMPPIPGERRRRQRSRSPLDYYRKNQNNNDGEFWDSFSWVPRISYTPNVSTSTLTNTKKMRRLMITNIPYEIGITEDDLKDIITRFMTQNYLKDQMNNCPVVNLQLNQTDHNVSVELSSVEETCRMCRMEKIELFKGFTNGIVRLGDSIYGNAVLTQAQTAGKAQAAAFAAINVIQNKKTNFSAESVATQATSSTLIRVTNAVTPYMAEHMNEEQWQDYFQDLMQGFQGYGTVIHNWFVKISQKDICADPGNLFIEYQYKQNAEAAYSQMQDRIYDQRKIKVFYVPRDLYYKNFKPNLTPPTLPPPLKTAKGQKTSQ